MERPDRTEKECVVNRQDPPTGRIRDRTGLLLVLLTLMAVFGGNGCAIKPIPLTEDEVQSRVKEDRAVLTKDQ